MSVDMKDIDDVVNHALGHADATARHANEGGVGDVSDLIEASTDIVVMLGIIAKELRLARLGAHR